MPFASYPFRSPDRKMCLFGLTLCLALLALGAAVLPVWGQESDFDPDIEARRIFTTVMSPYCPGLMLADCTSSAAAELRGRIKEQLARGRPPQEVMDELVATFGDDILALPPGRGAGLVAWVGPIAALLTSLLIIIWWIRQRRTPLSEAPALQPVQEEREANDAHPELRKRLEEELKQFD